VAFVPTRLGQVRLRAILFAALLVMGIGALPAASDAAAASRDLPVVPAQSARAFGDSMGVDVRLTYLDTSYSDFDTIHSRLRELGVRYVGDGLCPTCEYQIDRIHRLARDGIRANLGVGTPTGGAASIDAGLRVISNRLRSSVISVTSINEPDISGNPNWIADTRTFQRELYTRTKAMPGLAGMPVIGPALVHRGSRPALGDLSGQLDLGNLHPYPGGAPPLLNLPDELQLASYVSARKPVVATEIGYHTDLAFTGGNRPITERAEATYMPRIALEAYRGGISRTYIYQLADLWSPSEAARRGYPPSENSFGLLRWDLSRKPAFYSLRNLLTTVDGDSAPVATPGGLRFALEGAGPDVRSLLLRSANGSYSLVLWRTVSVWDWVGQQELNPPPDRVDVALGQPVALAQRFDPVASSAETQRWTSPSRIGVDLAGAPVVLRLTPPGAARNVERLRIGKPARRLRCGPALRKKKLRARACCAKASGSKHGVKGKKRRAARRHRAHKRVHASWSRSCISYGRYGRR
jgi:hypothetical protein